MLLDIVHLTNKVTACGKTSQTELSNKKYQYASLESEKKKIQVTLL